MNSKNMVKIVEVWNLEGGRKEGMWAGVFFLDYFT